MPFWSRQASAPRRNKPVAQLAADLGISKSCLFLGPRERDRPPTKLHRVSYGPDDSITNDFRRSD